MAALMAGALFAVMARDLWHDIIASAASRIVAVEVVPRGAWHSLRITLDTPELRWCTQDRSDLIFPTADPTAHHGLGSDRSGSVSDETRITASYSLPPWLTSGAWTFESDVTVTCRVLGVPFSFDVPPQRVGVTVP